MWVARWERSRWEAEEERTRSGLSVALEDERCVIVWMSASPWLFTNNLEREGVLYCGGSIWSSRSGVDNCSERRNCCSGR